MLRSQIAAWGPAEFHPRATAEAIDAVGSALGAPLPSELEDLLSETNGVDGELGVALVWPAERIAADNAYFRSDPTFAELYLPFEGLVFFADSGGGDQFAISLRGAGDIFRWDHEDDSRTWVASTVMDFLRRWMAGEIEVEG